MTGVRVLGALELVGPKGDADADAGSAEGTPLNSARLRRLLAGLVVRANAVASVDWLADVVWGAHSPANVDSAMHTLVSRLRSALRAAEEPHHSPANEQPVALLTRAPGYLLQIGAADLDASRFEQLATSARRLLEEADPTTAAERLDQALALWRGPAYAEVADEDFARAEAARLEELRTVAVEDCIEASLRLGRHHDVVARLEALTATTPLRERPHAQLMLARYRTGRQPDALSVFREFRQRLDDELGLEPSPELQRLHQQILQQDTSLEWSPPRQRLPTRAQTPTGTAVPEGSSPAPTSPAPTSPAPPSPAGQPQAAADAPSRPSSPRRTRRPRGNLPRTTTLVGRDDELAKLSDAILAGSVITLTGPGGVGKTSLALRAAADAVNRFSDGVWVSELATLSRPVEVAPAVLTALGVRARSGTGGLDRLVEYLRTKRLLLVVDNCEHLIGQAAALVDAIHSGCPHVGVLATSRRPLDIEGEQVWPVAPLPVPASSTRSRDDAADSPSVQLFVARAASQSREFALRDGNVGAVSEICRRLDGLPLALELAAARMRSMSPADLAGRLTWRLRLLHGGRRTAAERHRSLDALVNWSYDLLTADEQQVFEILSVFAGSFTLTTAEQLVAAIRVEPTTPDQQDVASIVLSLVDNSMLARLPGDVTQYTMLETLRGFGRDRLNARPYADDARRTHAELFADLGDSSLQDLWGPQHLAGVDRLARNLAEIRAAYTWSLDHDLATAAKLVGGMVPYVEFRMSAEVTQWALRVLERVEDQGIRVPGLAGVYTVASAGERFGGAMSEATGYACRGLAVADDPASIAYLHYLLADIDLYDGRFDDALRRARLAIDIARQGGLGSMVSWLSLAEVLVLAYTGRPREAAEAARELQLSAERRGETTLVSWAIYCQGESLIDLDPEEAARLLDRALHMARETDDRLLTGVTLVSAASVRSRNGDPADAASLFLDVIDHWDDEASWAFQWTTLRNVLDVLVRMGRFEAAAVLFGAQDGRSTASAVFGAEAELISAAAAQVASRLGDETFSQLCRRGRAMSDDTAVAFAREALRPETAE